MTRVTGIATLHRKFSLPVMLSVGLHGLAVAALGVFSLMPSVAPVPNPAMTVRLVPPSHAKVARHRPKPLQAVAKPVSVRKAHSPAAQRAVPRVVARIRPHAAPAARLPAVVVQPAPVTASSETQAEFKELPRVLAPAASPAVAHAGTAVFVLPDSMEPLDSLATGVGAAAVNRPLPVALSGGTRLLRDTAGEAGSVRSKVRPGNNPRPEYPRTAREAGWEGTVVLQVMVLPDGTAGAVTLHKTSGHAVLDEAALSAVKGWRFVPAMDGNFPVSSMVRLPVRFDLKAVN